MMKLRDMVDRISAQCEAIKAARENTRIPKHVNDWDAARRRRWITWFYEFKEELKRRKK